MAYQLPPAVPHFVDRQDERYRALHGVEGWRGRARPLVVAVSGGHGIGKTELAFEIAREMQDRYPDGVVYIDLNDLRHRGVIEVGDALVHLLDSLEVEPELVGQTFNARCAQYWSQTRGKRLAVVIDNARFGSEVVPLLPASGASMVIVTSQGPLYDLEDGAAVELALGPLEEADAADLLWRVTGDARLAAEPEAFDGMLRLCSGMPEALRVAGHWIRRRHRRPLSRLLAELTSELHEKGLPEVERVWDAAYRSLGPNGALLYRLLAVSPGPSFTPAAAVALLGRGQDAGDEALEELEEAGLLEARDVQSTGDERKRLPDLLRAHARRRAHEDGDEQELAEARQRIVCWYLRQAQRADRLAAGDRMVLAPRTARLAGTPDVEFAGKAHAHRWLEAERHALYECVRTGYALGADDQAWALCEPLWTHFLEHPHYADALDAFGTGLAAAQRAGDARAVVRMRCQLARPLWEQGSTAEAGRELERALRAVESTGDRKLQASVIEFNGMLHGVLGDWAAAAADFGASLRIHTEIVNPYGVMLLSYRLGQAVAELGEPQRAAELLEQAHASAVELERERMIARTGLALAGVLVGLGRGGEARALCEAALADARQRGSGYDEARVLDVLAAVADEAGDTAEAQTRRAAARAVRVRIGQV